MSILIFISSLFAIHRCDWEFRPPEEKTQVTKK